VCVTVVSPCGVLSGCELACDISTKKNINNKQVHEVGTLSCVFINMHWKTIIKTQGNVFICDQSEHTGKYTTQKVPTSCTCLLLIKVQNYKFFCTYVIDCWPLHVSTHTGHPQGYIISSLSKFVIKCDSLSAWIKMLIQCSLSNPN
jgi:hypothetical protein